MQPKGINESANEIPRSHWSRRIRAIHDASFLLAELLVIHSRQLNVNTLADFGKADGKKIGERATVTRLPDSQPTSSIEYPSARNSNKHFCVTACFSNNSVFRTAAVPQIPLPAWSFQYLLRPSNAKSGCRNFAGLPNPVSVASAAR